jgi:hypothetical protein
MCRKLSVIIFLNKFLLFDIFRCFLNPDSPNIQSFNNFPKLLKFFISLNSCYFFSLPCILKEIVFKLTKSFCPGVNYFLCVCVCVCLVVLVFELKISQSRWAFYHLRHASCTFCLITFLDRILSFCPCLALDHDPPTDASCVAGIITQFIC